MDNNIWTVLTPVLVALGGALAAIITVVGTQLAVKVRKWFDAKYGKENMEVAISIAEVVVGAVEEQAKKYGWDSQEKLNQAIERLRLFLENRKIYFTSDEMQQLVESALQLMREVWNSYKKGEVCIPPEATKPIIPDPEKIEESNG